MSAHDFRVLVVDDDPDMLNILARMIAAEGMHVDTALDGDAALVHAMTSPPDLILLGEGAGEQARYAFAAALSLHPHLPRARGALADKA